MNKKLVFLLQVIILGLAVLLWPEDSYSCPPTCLGEKLGAVNWDRKDLAGAVMLQTVARHASMEDVNFSNADLTGFDMLGGNLKGINFSGADLIGADLGGTYLSGAVFNDTDLTAASLAQADLTGARLVNSRLAAVYFEKTRLVNADLSQLNLAGTYLRNSQLSGANLNRINLAGGVLDRTDFSGADLRYADLRGAWINLSTLTGANLHGADLSGASLIGTDLTGCDLSGASLAGANLIGAVLRGSNLSGADLTAVQMIASPELLDREYMDDDIFRNLSATQWEDLNLSDTILDGAMYDLDTRWPENYELPASLLYKPSSTPVSGAPAAKSFESVAGSRSVYFLASVLADGYMIEHPDVFFDFTVTDSSDGIEQAGSGRVLVGMSSRPPSSEELARFPNLQVYPIALDAVSVVVNPQNPVSQLSLEQLRSILSGEITNWKDAGGPDLPITILSQNDTLIDFVFGKLEIAEIDDLSGQFATILPSHPAVRAEVSADQGAIGLLPRHLADRSVKEISIAGQLPEPQAIRNDTYPIIRMFYLVVNGKPDPVASDWIAYIQGAAGRALIEQEGFEIIQNE